MGSLVVYDIRLEDGRKDLTWIEDDDNPEPYERFEMTQSVWDEILKLIEQEFGSKVIKFKWEFDKDDEDEYDDY